MAQRSKPPGWLIAMIVVTLLGVLGNLAIDVSRDENGATHVVIHRVPKTLVPATIAVDGPDRDAKADDPVTLDKEARAVAGGFAANARDLKGNLTGPIIGPVAKLEPPFAADEVPGCRTRFLRTNWSARSAPQSSVKLFWLHYTGGPDVPGTRSEVDGLTAFGNSPAARVSWTFNMDKDGNCDYNVPMRYKAWTEAGANSTGISIEVAGVGSPPYLRPGGYRQLLRIYHAVHSAYPAIALRLGGVSNCSPTRGGIVTHWMGGPCSGGHTDIRPLDLNAVIDNLVRLERASGRAADLRSRNGATHRALKSHRCSLRRPALRRHVVGIHGGAGRDDVRRRHRVRPGASVAELDLDLRPDAERLPGGRALARVDAPADALGLGARRELC
jgi:hypothetical protein